MESVTIGLSSLHKYVGVFAIVETICNEVCDTQFMCFAKKDDIAVAGFVPIIKGIVIGPMPRLLEHEDELVINIWSIEEIRAKVREYKCEVL